MTTAVIPWSFPAPIPTIDCRDPTGGWLGLKAQFPRAQSGAWIQNRAPLLLESLGLEMSATGGRGGPAVGGPCFLANPGPKGPAQLLG